MKKVIKFIQVLIAIIMLFCCSGCFMAIQQYQREYLGDPIMYFDYDKEEKSLNEHIYPRREGSSGGYGGAGGGCGC